MTAQSLDMTGTAIFGELFNFAGQTDPDRPVRISVNLPGKQPLMVGLRGSGEVSIAPGLLSAADLGEDGHIYVEDITDRLDATIRESDITGLRQIVDNRQRTIGVALMRDGREAVCIWNDDDEFRWGDETGLARSPLRDGSVPNLGAVL